MKKLIALNFVMWVALSGCKNYSNTGTGPTQWPGLGTRPTFSTNPDIDGRLDTKHLWGN